MQIIQLSHGCRASLIQAEAWVLSAACPALGLGDQRAGISALPTPHFHSQQTVRAHLGGPSARLNTGWKSLVCSSSFMSMGLEPCLPETLLPVGCWPDIHGPSNVTSTLHTRLDPPSCLLLSSGLCAFPESSTSCWLPPPLCSLSSCSIDKAAHTSHAQWGPSSHPQSQPCPLSTATQHTVDVHKHRWPGLTST